MGRGRCGLRFGRDQRDSDGNDRSWFRVSMSNRVSASDWPARERLGPPASAGRFYAVVKDPRRGERLIGEEPWAQRSGRGVVRYPVERGAPQRQMQRGTPTHSIQYGKKRFGGFRFVLMGIQAVTGFCLNWALKARLPLKRCKTYWPRVAHQRPAREEIWRRYRRGK